MFVSPMVFFRRVSVCFCVIIVDILYGGRNSIIRDCGAEKTRVVAWPGPQAPSWVA